MIRGKVLLRVGLLLSCALACSCRSAPSGGAGAAATQFQPALPRTYVSKVKNILVGLAPTDRELQAVERDGAALGGLVDGWMMLPQYSQKMMHFFELAFQQTQINANDFADEVFAPIGLNPATTPMILRNVQESFARTMVELTAEGHPLTEAMTTQTVMMTTALKELYAFLDTVDIDDTGFVYDHFRATHRNVGIVVEASQGPIPIAETLDPTSANYMHWYDPDAAIPLTPPECQQDPVTLRPQAITLHYLLLGAIDLRVLQNNEICPPLSGTSRGPQFTASDFDDWTMVTMRPPGPGEATTAFYDLPALRAAGELVLSTPRVGFFSTPAFLANWRTNVSNEMRVTVHQALIVATGSSIDGTDTTHVPGSPGLDSAHAGQAACFDCHKILDPTRSILSATWSWYYHRQLDPAWTSQSQSSVFAFRGIVQPVSTIAEFGGVLARHPLVASGWVQKLCYYVNSAPCDESDPEFQRLVGLFQGSNYSWSTLVRAFATSPITTHAADTRTAEQNGEVLSVSRQGHFCAALGARLGRNDACDLDAPDPDAGATTPLIAAGLPSDAYGRGAVAPILPNDPSLFFRAGVENICENVAAEVIDAPSGASPSGAKQWSSAQPHAAIADFVASLMALPPSDGRAAAAQALLEAHFASAREQPGITATQALQSTFVVACMAPSAVSIGL